MYEQFKFFLFTFFLSFSLSFSFFLDLSSINTHDSTAIFTSGTLVGKICMKLSTVVTPESLAAAFLAFGRNLVACETKREEVAKSLYEGIASPLCKHCETYDAQLNHFLKRASEQSKEKKRKLEHAKVLSWNYYSFIIVSYK